MVETNTTSGKPRKFHTNYNGKPYRFEIKEDITPYECAMYIELLILGAMGQGQLKEADSVERIKDLERHMVPVEEDK